MLKYATDNSYFIFNKEYYKQNEGLAMGQPLSAPLANAFLCYNEKLWLHECPSEFKPTFYKRYVDDTYVIFKKKEHAEKFFEYINSRHPKIKFTMETEKEKKIPFLDMLIERQESSMKTTLYRKKTYTGVGLNFTSFCFHNFKLNSFSTFIYRAWRLTTSYMDFHKEVEFLRTFFLNNGYPEYIFFHKLKKFLNNIFLPKAKISTAEKDLIYVKMPYYGETIAKELNKQMRKILEQYYPQIKLRIVYFNHFKIKAFFKHKDIVPPAWCSDIVYMYKCAICDNCYLGSSNRSLAIRVSEHQGRSYRTKQLVSRPLQSAVRDHSENSCSKMVSSDEFSIIYKGNNNIDIRIAESLLIKELKPTLNNDTSSYPLKLF